MSIFRSVQSALISFREMQKCLDIPKYLLISIVCIHFFFSGVISASAQELTSSFQLWMLNNEARAIGILTADRAIFARMSAPFGFLPAIDLPMPRSEEKIWKKNLNLYKILPEFNEIFELARRFGSGNFAKTFEHAHPGKWATAVIIGIPVFHVWRIADPIDKAFQEAFLVTMGISKNRDGDLAKRLTTSVEKLSDTDKRMMNAYLGHFVALYPGNNQTRQFESIFQNGIKKDLSKGLAALIGDSAATGTMSTSSKTVEKVPVANDSPVMPGLDSGDGSNASTSVSDVNNATGSASATGPANQQSDSNGSDPFTILEPGK
ncbi:MAG: hypothetical protein HQM09_02270 [Candidatus Riflebacteria bacterium]|nr:hypothetical protein [Candidatus Riflebacteria bacterium]